VAEDDEPVPVARRQVAAEVRDEPDVRCKIAIFVEGLVDRLARSADPGRQARRRLPHADLGEAAPGGPHRHDDAGPPPPRAGHLRDDIELDEVRDVLWNYLAIDHYERLVLMQGWSHNHPGQWLTRAVTSALCP
jgi:hypothetical protein